MKRSIPFLTVTALVLVVAACGASGGGLGTLDPGSPSTGPSLPSASPDLTPQPGSPSIPPSTEPTAPGSPAPGTPSTAPGETMIVRTYFHLAGDVDSEGIVAVLREVAKTPAVGSAAINELLEGPSGDEQAASPSISTAIPAGTRLLGLSIAGGVATVDLSGEFESGGGSASAIGRLAQVVFTLTQFPTVDAVLFRVNGQEVTVFGGEGIVLDGPQARDDYDDLLPAIWVDRPAWGAAFGNPGRVTGSADVFEASFRITVLDASGVAVADEHTMATCGTGCRGTFDATIRYDVDEPQWGTLRVWSGSAQDGSPVNVREYPVWLTPAG